MAGQLQLPSLGRPFKLGMLYNCHTEKLIPGLTLWDAQKLKSVLHVKEEPSSSHNVIAEDTLHQKSLSLGIDPDLKLSLMSGLVTVDGAANYLRDEKHSNKQSRVTLQYSSTTQVEQLSMDQIGDVQFPEMLNDQDVTHVVTGIQYGADAFFVFDCLLKEGEKMIDVYGNMQAAVESITKGVSGGASMSHSKSETDKFRCKFYGDLSPLSIPSSFDEARRLYEDLPRLLNDGVGVPKLIHLSPLSTLGQTLSQQMSNPVKISFGVISQVEEIMKHLHDTEMHINDLSSHDVCHKFVEIKAQLATLKNLITRFKTSFASDLSQIVPKVRSAQEKEEKLAELISSVNASPFGSKTMGKYLRDKEKEINYLAQCLRQAAKESKIQFDFPDTDCNLSELIFDFDIEQVACFGFNVTSDTSPFIKNLECYLQTGEAKQIDKPEWFNTSVAKQLKAKLIQFVEYVKTSGDKGTSFVVTNSDSEASETGPSLILHSSSDSTPFDPSGKSATATNAATTSMTQKSERFYAPQSRFSISLADQFFMHSKHIEPKSEIPIYKLPLRKVMEDRVNKLRHYEIVLPGTQVDLYTKPEKVLMVLGATGAGKSTLINGMANYILGITWKENFRFKIVTDEGERSQAYSQTKYITAYSFRTTNMSYNLTVVDTPGFGDTGGIENDRKIAEQIKKFFSGRKDTCSIDILHGIGFVTQASLSRLTPTQRFIFTSILAIFGKNISDNIFLMTTFADAKTPPVLEAVKIAKIPYRRNFKFNNSALFANNQSAQTTFDSMFWDMGYVSFADFFDSFSQVEAKSLALTREVLMERERLEMLIPKLQEQVRIGMAKMDEIKQEERMIRQHEAEINANKDFTFPFEVTAFRKKKLDPGIHTTTCQVCNFTCHNGCAIPNDDDKRGCIAMSGDNCTICPKKCHWSQHSNVPYVFEYYKKMETRTSADLKKRYDSAKSGKESAEAMIAENEDKLCNLHVDVHLMIERMHKSIERLRQIALKPNPLTEIEYLDLLIESEKQEAKYGWQDRVKKLQEFRKDAELYQKVASGQFSSLTAAIEYDRRPNLMQRVKQYWKARSNSESTSIWATIFGSS